MKITVTHHNRETLGNQVQAAWDELLKIQEQLNQARQRWCTLAEAVEDFDLKERLKAEVREELRQRSLQQPPPTK